MYFLTMLSVAFATTYYSDFDIESDDPPAMAPIAKNSTDITAELRYDVGTANSDTIISSSWSYIECAVEDGDVVAIFTATDSTWPTSWPNTVTCSGGGDTWSLSIGNGAWGNAQSWAYQSTVTFSLEDDEARTLTKFLPNAYSYDDAWPWFSAKKNSAGTNGNYSGVKCQVLELTNGKHILGIEVRETANAGTAWCRAPKVGSGTTNIKVKITR